MNVCFKYNLMGSLNTNEADAAYRWAIYDTQVKYKKIPNPNDPSTTLLVKDTEADKKIIYIYESGNKVEDKGGRYDLICRINSCVRKHPKVKGEHIRLKVPTTAVRILEESDVNSELEELGDISDLLTPEITREKTPTLKGPDDEYTEQVRKEVYEMIDNSKSTSYSASMTEVKNSKVMEDNYIPAKATADMRQSDVIADYIAQGYELDVESLPITMEVYSRAVKYLKNKTFDENYDKTNVDSGDNYAISNYVISLLFTKGKARFGMSWVESQIQIIVEGFYEAKQGVMQTASLTVPDKENSEKEIVDVKVEEGLSRGKIDYNDIIESRDSFKQIFCSLAIVSTHRKSTLWELLINKYCKKLFNQNNSENFLDIDDFELAEQLQEKYKYKDCDIRDHDSVIDTIGSEKSWEFQILRKAIKWLCMPHHNIDIHLINENFLRRTDLIRACRDEEEFLNMIRWDSGVDFKSQSLLTREKIICQRLDLVNNSQFIKLKDIEELAVCESSKLISKLEYINAKINDSISRIKECEDDIANCEQTIANLRGFLEEGVCRGEEIDFTAKQYYLGDLKHSHYVGYIKQSSASSTHKEYVFMRVHSNGIEILDRFRARHKDYQNITLKDLYNFSEAKLRPTGLILDDAKKAEINETIAEYEARIDKNNHTIAKLHGQDSVYAIRNIARPSSDVECEARILNTWVDKLIAKFRAREARLVQLASTYRKENLKTPQEVEANMRALKCKVLIENLSRNMNYNLQHVKEDCASYFANNHKGYTTDSVHCNKWFLKNNEGDILTRQTSVIYRASSDGGKVNHGSTQTMALVHKEGLYVIVLDDIHMIIPMWYGCQTLNDSLKSQYYRKIRCYSDNLTDVLFTVATLYRANRDNEEYLEKFSEETGIYFLSKEEAYECVDELREYRDSILLTTVFDKNSQKQVRQYHGVFKSLASLAGVALDNPKETEKLKRAGKITI